MVKNQGDPSQAENQVITSSSARYCSCFLADPYIGLRRLVFCRWYPLPISWIAIDFLLSISNERQTIKEFSKGVYDYIDMLWANDYFPSCLSQPLNILNSENVAGDSGTSNEKLQERFHGYINSLTKYAGIYTEQLAYIHDFDRKVTIFNSNKTGYIEVHTVTDITYVNLRDTSYYAEHTSQFRKSDGSGKSYRIVQVKANGKDKTKEAQDQLKGAKLKPVYEDSVFESGKNVLMRYPPTRPEERIKIICVNYHKTGAKRVKWENTTLRTRSDIQARRHRIQNDVDVDDSACVPPEEKHP